MKNLVLSVLGVALLAHTTTANPSSNDDCPSGQYYDEGAAHCLDCPTIANHTGGVRCSSLDGSKSDGGSCNPGYYLVVDPGADTCETCPTIAIHTGGVVCTDGSGSKSDGGSCNDGYYLVSGRGADTCEKCSIANHTGGVVCTDGSGSKSDGGSCNPGYYLDSGPGADTCEKCSIANHTGGVICSNPKDSKSSKESGSCNSGYYLVSAQLADACVQCAIENHNASVSCTDATDARSIDDGKCDLGYFLEHGPDADSCRRCDATSGWYEESTGECSECEPIRFWEGDVTCSDLNNSRGVVDGTGSCKSGHFLFDSFGNLTYDVCAECAPISKAWVGDVTCSNESDSRGVEGGSCRTGLYWEHAETPGESDTCELCTQIEHLDRKKLSDISCTDDTDSKADMGVSCNQGYYLKKGAADAPDTCELCTPIEHFTGLLFCDSPDLTAIYNNDGKLGCEPGYYLAYDPQSNFTVLQPPGDYDLYQYGMVCNECTANNEHVASWRPHVRPSKCWELTQYDEEVCGGTDLQPCFDDTRNFNEDPAVIPSFNCESWERCGVYCGYDETAFAPGTYDNDPNNRQVAYSDQALYVEGLPSFVESFTSTANASFSLEVQCVPRTCDSGFELGMRAKEVRSFTDSSSSSPSAIEAASEDSDNADDGDISYANVLLPSCVPSPVIASLSNDSSSNSSKDEGKYIFLFVCVGFVLGGLVAAALYAAGCIGSKAGADVSALPTKAPVQAVEFTTAQETA